MKYMNAQSGFTMIEVLLALLGTSLCTLLCVQIATLIGHHQINDHRVEDEIAIKQLRLILAQSEIMDVEEQCLSFYYHEDVFRLVRYEDKLVKRKGFEVMLQDVDSIQFYQENMCIFLSYRRDDRERQVELACEE